MRSKVAYIVSRFPTITETFILYEILELERLGLRIHIFPLIRQNECVKHVEVNQLHRQVHYNSVFSFATLTAQFYWLARAPKCYLLAWWQAIRGNLSSAKFLSRALLVVPLAARFSRQVKTLGIEHIHAHWATHPTLAAYIISRLTGLSYSFTAHAHDIYVERPMLAEKIRMASWVVTISDYNRRLLNTLYGTTASEKTVVIHCGIDPEVFQFKQGKKPGTPFTIICIASLKDYKGHGDLLEACRLLKAQGVASRCWLVGEGGERRKIEASLRALGLNDCVTLLGAQPRNRVLELLADADVMVLPSVVTSSGKMEGIPLALMEALAMGVPAIATAISGIPELIKDGETGTLVPEHDPQAIYRALLLLYNSPERARKFAKAGRDRVVEKFNLHTNTAELYSLLSRESVSPLASEIPFDSSSARSGKGYDA